MSTALEIAKGFIRDRGWSPIPIPFKTKCPVLEGWPELRGPKWLLSGLLQCADCGSNLVMTDGRHYSCSTYRNGGVAACSNGMRVKREVAETKLLAALKEQLLAPDKIAEVQRRVRQSLAERQRLAGDESQSRAQRLRAVDREIGNVADAIATGGLSGSRILADKLRALEAEREALALQAQQPDHKVVTMIPRVAERFRALVGGFEARASRADARDNARARTALKQFLGAVRVEAEIIDGSRVPVAVLKGNSRAILRVVGAESSATDNFGSGGRI